MVKVTEFALRCANCGGWNTGRDPIDFEGAWCPECDWVTDWFEAWKAAHPRTSGFPPEGVQTGAHQ